MFDRDLVLADVLRASREWTAAGIKPPDIRRLDEAVDLAAAALAGRRDSDTGQRARICLVTKGPHMLSPLPLACVVARLAAFGVTVHTVRRIERSGHDVARALYGRAHQYFDAGPTAPALWTRLAQRFDNDDFATIFGRRYDRSIVMPAAAVMRANRLSPAQLTEIWETGRAPVTRDVLVRRYGASVAAFVLDGADCYDWFRARLPIGISRVAPALTAFALRDERVNGGDPVVVLNGHVPGLAALFAPQAWVLEAGLGRGIDIDDVRRMVVGEDSRPERCRAGSIRADAAAGQLPLADGAVVTSRHNVIHGSDGLLAGLIEVRRLLPDRAADPDLLTSELIRAGLTRPEIERIVHADPYVMPIEPEPYLTDLTRGLDFAGCVTEILRVVPPVFGPANGYASGLTFGAVDRALRVVATSSAAIPAAARSDPVTMTADPDARDEATGREIIADGGLGVLVPAGGTGGRFGGYGVSEAEAARQKVLAQVFTVDGRRLSSLDIRLANVRHWDSTGIRQSSVAVMAAPTNVDALRRWRASLDDPYRSSVQLLMQHGIYRLDAALAASGRWVDAVLRDTAGRPSLKPPGNLGLLSSFVISGLFEAWEARGVSYLAIANGDDAGHRLDPRVLGYLAARPTVDAVVLGVPWGFTATVWLSGVSRSVRGDESGWVVDESGKSVASPVPASARVHDRGGALRLANDGTDQRLSIMEGRRPEGALFNTNQFYVRLSALRRMLNRAGTADPVEAVRRTLAKVPMTLEEKVVRLDGVDVRAVQLTQPLHALVSFVDRCDVLTTTRHVVPGVRTSYATLKTPSDVPFAQVIVDALWNECPELNLGPQVVDKAASIRFDTATDVRPP